MHPDLGLQRHLLLRFLIPNSLGNLLWSELAFIYFCVFEFSPTEVSFSESSFAEIGSSKNGPI
jgi:hypothetical protein